MTPSVRKHHGIVLAANAEMIFRDLPYVDRVRRIHERGYQVEIWDWTTRDLAMLAATGATFSSMTGYIRGDLIDDDGSVEFLATAEESLRTAEVLDAARLNVHGTGLGPDGLPVHPRHSVTGSDWLRAAHTLNRLAILGEKHGRVFTLENLNTRVDHPGTPFAAAEDTIALVEAVGNPHLRLNLDLYHAQIGEGNLIELIQRALPHIGEIQVADVPGRFEPGTGEIAYPKIAENLREVGYQGVVAMEAWARHDSETALDEFAKAFRTGNI